VIVVEKPSRSARIDRSELCKPLPSINISKFSNKAEHTFN
jgi:hypothetical protein